MYIFTFQGALLIDYEQSLDKARSITFSQRSSSKRLLEDETFNDNEVINNFIDYEEQQEEPDSRRTDIIQLSSKFWTLI
ncbi:hypothetical protein TNCV_1596991 [Trichonephila clavipes]|nr:hypothetical protein TNCV_1596991 [Trichonephila clavipes]